MEPSTAYFVSFHWTLLTQGLGMLLFVPNSVTTMTCIGATSVYA